MHPSHKEILNEIKRKAGKATHHSFLESYLGNNHPRYPISSPELRKIAKEWAAGNTDMSSGDFSTVVSSLIHGESFTEKCIGGILLDYAKPHQRKFDPGLFDEWLDQLQGWAEVDALCTGKFQLTEMPPNFKKWKPLLTKLNKSKSPEKQRASLVLFCSPISHCEEESMADLALKNMSGLKQEKDILITKAISWLLRSMIRHHREKVVDFLDKNKSSLPAIAVRETLIKLKTGKKGGLKK
jgi:3-methyladenine DNA glycosylase AlkD